MKLNRRPQASHPTTGAEGSAPCLGVRARAALARLGRLRCGYSALRDLSAVLSRNSFTRRFRNGTLKSRLPRLFFGCRQRRQTLFL